MASGDPVACALRSGENSTIEFKEALGNLDREMVAFANSK